MQSKIHYDIVATTKDTDPFIAWNALAHLHNQSCIVRQWHNKSDVMSESVAFLENHGNCVLMVFYVHRNTLNWACTPFEVNSTPISIPVPRTIGWFEGVYTCENLNCPGATCRECKHAQYGAWKNYQVAQLEKAITDRGLVSLEHLISQTRHQIRDVIRAAFGDRQLGSPVFDMMVDYIAPPEWKPIPRGCVVISFNQMVRRVPGQEVASKYKGTSDDSYSDDSDSEDEDNPRDDNSDNDEEGNTDESDDEISEHWS